MLYVFTGALTYMYTRAATYDRLLLALRKHQKYKGGRDLVHYGKKMLFLDAFLLLCEVIALGVGSAIHFCVRIG